jgi:hypothetical protein
VCHAGFTRILRLSPFPLLSTHFEYSLFRDTKEDNFLCQQRWLFDGLAGFLPLCFHFRLFKRRSSERPNRLIVRQSNNQSSWDDQFGLSCRGQGQRSQRRRKESSAVGQQQCYKSKVKQNCLITNANELVTGRTVATSPTSGRFVFVGRSNGSRYSTESTLFINFRSARLANRTLSVRRLLSIALDTT